MGSCMLNIELPFFWDLLIGRYEPIGRCREKGLSMCLGIPGQIIAIVDKSAQLVEVDVLGVRRVIDVLCVLEEEQSITDLLGCWVLIHVGFAMSLIDENEARHTLEALERMGTLENETTALSLTAVSQGVTQTGSQ